MGENSAKPFNVLRNEIKELDTENESLNTIKVEFQKSINAFHHVNKNKDKTDIILC